jgi:hypothetical protein
VWKSVEIPLAEARKLESLIKKQKGGIGFYNLTGLPPVRFESGFRTTNPDSR